MRIQWIGETPHTETTDAVVVYDAKSGEIMHVHRVVSFSGAAVPSRDAVEEEARTLATNIGRPTVKLEVLHCDPGTLQSGKQYKVDLKSRTLVEKRTKRNREPADSKRR